MRREEIQNRIHQTIRMTSEKDIQDAVEIIRNTKEKRYFENARINRELIYNMRLKSVNFQIGAINGVPKTIEIPVYNARFLRYDELLNSYRLIPDTDRFWWVVSWKEGEIVGKEQKTGMCLLPFGSKVTEGVFLRPVLCTADLRLFGIEPGDRIEIDGEEFTVYDFNKAIRNDCLERAMTRKVFYEEKWKDTNTYLDKWLDSFAAKCSSGRWSALDSGLEVS